MPDDSSLAVQRLSKLRSLRGDRANVRKPGDTGRFYVIQTFPEADPQRIKLGWSAQLDRRVRQYRTAAPTAKLLKSWPCRRVDESRAIEYLARFATKRLSPETFDFPDIEKLIAAVDDYFLVLDVLKYGENQPNDFSLKSITPCDNVQTSADHSMKDPSLGKIIEWEITVPWKPEKRATTQWLAKKLWIPLSDYFVEVASSAHSLGVRKFRLRIEVVQ